ncbi:MAG: sigma-54 dependent transcriptional regulator [Polyangia bacterium]|jgi:DNA-binding NtrC family response regulator
MLDILLIDDEADVRLPLGEALRDLGHHVSLASDGGEAMRCLDHQTFNLVMSDVRLPKVDGFAILRRVRDERPDTHVVLMTAFGTIQEAVAAVKEAAVDYVTKPFELAEILNIVQRIDERWKLLRELAEARAQLAATNPDHLIEGRSPAMAHLRAQIAAIANSSAAVLLAGESGTGKELAARMIHASSDRRARPFIPVNCAAVPATLIEAELFGHERGAFTGAVKRREGRFKAADGGTLFLDEIGEMPVEVQVKLLRVLQDGAFEPIGTNSPIKVDVRLISASNRDLKAMVASGRFRQDLYYRIKVFELPLPPLRQRLVDLPILVEQFLREFAPQGAQPATITPAAWAALQTYSYPGNVRELKHAIQHATILSQGQQIEPHHLPSEFHGSNRVEAQAPGVTEPLAMAMAQFEKRYIERTLQAASGERARTAEMLGISRKNLWEKMVKYNLK